MTRSTRRAANASAVAVLIFLALWLLTTQIEAVRSLSPFADDPWDAVATYAAIFLPVVAGATWIRSLRHRGPVLPGAAARRIRWGAGLAAAIVLVSAAADALAILAEPPIDGGLTTAVIAVLVALSIIASIVAVGLTVRAGRVGLRRSSPAPVPEPDIVDDLFALAADVARPLGLRGIVERFTGAVDRFLERSALSPRRHRRLFGLVLALGCGAAFALWHSIREGPSPSLVVPVVFATLTASGVFSAYLGTLVPLRLLRSPRT